jgi:hypothetical protein
MTIERAQQIAAAIARSFKVFECDDCAKAIAKRLGRDFDACFVRLRTADNTDGIWFEAEALMISKNRVHIGVRIGDLIFDNLHQEGVAATQWPSRFVAVTGASLEQQSRPTSEFFGKIFLAEKFSRWFSGH